VTRNATTDAMDGVSRAVARSRCAHLVDPSMRTAQGAIVARSDTQQRAHASLGHDTWCAHRPRCSCASCAGVASHTRARMIDTSCRN
jgi:hypothetical protein